MKTLLIATTLIATSCTTGNLTESPFWISKIAERIKGKKEEPTEQYRARITYYSVGEDKWGDKVACPNTYRAKEGITIAAHPQFKFGTKVLIPELEGVIGDGTFIVQDRGSWVTRKKAAQGKVFVFDVFVKNQTRMHKHARNRPMYMNVKVLKD